MTKIWPILVCALALMLVPVRGNAQERLVDGAGGALAGALVAGPVGLIAGGVIGYAAGPNIARGMGLKHHRHHRHARHVKHRN